MGVTSPHSYNVLITKTWAMLVPRSKETYTSSIALNSLAYAGSLLARTPDDMDIIRTVGPLNVLMHCAYLV